MELWNWSLSQSSNYLPTKILKFIDILNTKYFKIRYVSLSNQHHFEKLQIWLCVCFLRRHVRRSVNWFWKIISRINLLISETLSKNYQIVIIRNYQLWSSSCCGVTSRAFLYTLGGITVGYCFLNVWQPILLGGRTELGGRTALPWQHVLQGSWSQAWL